MKFSSHLFMAVCMVFSALLGGFAATTLAPQPAQAAALSFGPQVNLTLLAVPNTQQTGLSFIYSKIGDIGTFTVQNGSSLVEVTHQGRLLVTNLVTATGVVFELRVDDQSPLENSGLVLIRASETNTYIPSTFSGYWKDLAPGEHTVSLWARTAQQGSANAVMNPGGWSINDVIVKEYLPFGSTALPIVTR